LLAVGSQYLRAIWSQVRPNHGTHPLLPDHERPRLRGSVSPVARRGPGGRGVDRVSEPPAAV